MGDNQYYVATCCFDQKTRVFDMRDKQVVTMLQQHSDDVIGISFSGDRQLLATGSDDGYICLWDARTWKLQRKFNTREEEGLRDNEVKRVAFSPDGNKLAAACSSRLALVYDLTTMQSIGRCDGHEDCCFDVAWGKLPTSGETILVTASHDKKAKFWKVA